MRDKLKQIIEDYSMPVDQITRIEDVIKEIDMVLEILHDSHADSQERYLPSIALVRTILKKGY